jgi:hypothetical protein
MSSKADTLGPGGIDAAVYAEDVGVFRSARSNWNFTDDSGAQGAYTVFTITGDVYIEQLYGVCQVTLTSGGAPTIEVGITGNTAAMIAQTTALDLDQYELWQDATPETNPGVVILLGRSWVVANGANIIFTVATADLTAGDIDFHCTWRPLSADSNLVAA